MFPRGMRDNHAFLGRLTKCISSFFSGIIYYYSCLTSYFRSMLPFYGYKKISRIRGRKKHLYTADPDHSSFPCAGPKEIRKSKENDLSHSRRSNNYFLSGLTISVRSGSSSPAHSEFLMLHCNIPQRSVCAPDTPVPYDQIGKIDADCSVFSMNIYHLAVAGGKYLFLSLQVLQSPNQLPQVPLNCLSCQPRCWPAFS
jgi:hypothetical protein